MPYPQNITTSRYISEEETERFLCFVQQNLNLNLRPYNRNSLNRRIAKMINRFGLHNVDELLRYFEGKQHAQYLLIENFVVHVTSLFREPLANYQLIRQVFTTWRNNSRIKIWMVGCSTGEEVLSMAIMLKEHNLLNRTQILASDLDESALLKNQLKISPQDMQDAEERYHASGGQLSLENYFTGIAGHYYFDASLLNEVRFEVFDLVQDHMEEQFDLVWCKNVLIYFDPDYQHGLLEKLSNALHPGGYLTLGERESLAFYQHQHRFSRLMEEHKLYRLNF